MRHLLLVLIGLTLAGCASTPDEPVRAVTIEEIKPRYIPEENFVRISEYWSGAENKGRRVILRSDPEVRDGFYFTLVLDEKVRELPRGTVITGEFHTPVSAKRQTHDFALPNKLPKTREVFVGLTGADWPEPGGVPAAWRFTIKDANGEVLARKQSYLWSM
ncbi:MAG: hypothetical protein R6U56_10500 [Opitutales bacterium]